MPPPKFAAIQKSVNINVPRLEALDRVLLALCKQDATLPGILSVANSTSARARLYLASCHSRKAHHE